MYERPVAIGDKRDDCTICTASSCCGQSFESGSFIPDPGLNSQIISDIVPDSKYINTVSYTVHFHVKKVDKSGSDRPKSSKIDRIQFNTGLAALWALIQTTKKRSRIQRATYGKKWQKTVGAVSPINQSNLRERTSHFFVHEKQGCGSTSL